MMNREIPLSVMRGGTSRGLFFLKENLPESIIERDPILLKIIGAGERRGVNGLGSEDPLLNKMAIVSKSLRSDCDIEYQFIQGNCEKRLLDTSVSCGNMIAAVGQFAIENGLIQPSLSATQATVKIFNLNTNKRVDSSFPIKNGLPVYEGDQLIDGVCDSAAPVWLNFYSPNGAVTASFFPTGNKIENIDGIPCTVIDCATLLIVIQARDLNLTGMESPQLLNAEKALIEKLIKIRQVICTKLNLLQANYSVLPKICIISPAKRNGDICARFFTPLTCHAAIPLTGAIALAAASINVHQIPQRLLNQTPFSFQVEHPEGILEMSLSLKKEGDIHLIEKVGFVRTARKIMSGFAYF